MTASRIQQFCRTFNTLLDKETEVRFFEPSRTQNSSTGRKIPLAKGFAQSGRGGLLIDDLLPQC